MLTTQNFNIIARSPSLRNSWRAVAFSGSAAILLTACNSFWPSIRVQSEGLGNTPLGRKLQVIWMSGDKQLNEQIKRLLAQQDGTPRERAEAIGMQCDPLPSRRCHYEGFVLHEFTGPKSLRTPPEGKQREDIAVTLADHDDVATLSTVKRASTPS